MTTTSWNNEDDVNDDNNDGVMIYVRREEDTKIVSTWFACVCVGEISLISVKKKYHTYIGNLKIYQKVNLIILVC